MLRQIAESVRINRVAKRSLIRRKRLRMSDVRRYMKSVDYSGHLVCLILIINSFNIQDAWPNIPEEAETFSQILLQFYRILYIYFI